MASTALRTATSPPSRETVWISSIASRGHAASRCLSLVNSSTVQPRRRHSSRNASPLKYVAMQRIVSIYTRRGGINRGGRGDRRDCTAHFQCRQCCFCALRGLCGLVVFVRLHAPGTASLV